MREHVVTGADHVLWASAAPTSAHATLQEPRWVRPRARRGRIVLEFSIV